MAINSLDYVDDARAGTDPGLFLEPPAPAPADWSTTPPWFDEAGWVLPMGGFLVRTEGRTVLIDAGIGPDTNTMMAGLDTPPSFEYSSELLNSLAALNVTPDEVTDVVLTHLHFDHIGWIAPRGEPVFPHARHVCHRGDIERMRADSGGDRAWAGVRGHVDAVSDLLVVADAERTEVADGVAPTAVRGTQPRQLRD
ncbi:MBL fold metallo-hydrolase [Mycobacterium branderi]|uniref:Metallo-beta-lactamase domain-containing protein n=1 Tax=Mycobacterium branderi TaxID=43348 RepID=A0A7I7W183_9MYCO|nr:MBL fold metallo-hydrolase [Mycobacterium branderi]MCV7235050.1 MBL fold metallo-hydrolase [Mycobacterium branderi]ORA36722.1 hypothetical protein BST20_15605 [Mycobacterium branderi]BBZ11316.1 hypothetical protein MBRA_15110 [Mycobacterium branderi]